MSLEYIRNTYNVPAKRGTRVKFRLIGTNKVVEGVIIGSHGAYLRVRCDDGNIVILHPIFKVEYLPDKDIEVLETHKIDHTTHTLDIEYDGMWFLRIHEYVNGGRIFRGTYIIGERGHKDISKITGIPWSYYKKCMEVDSYGILAKNVNYWINTLSVSKTIESIQIVKDDVKIINKKSKGGA
jgi:hypothetical protein